MHVKEKEETNELCVLCKENPQLFSVLPVLVVISQANSWSFTALKYRVQNVFLGHYKLPKTFCHVGYFYTSNNAVLVAVILILSIIQCHVAR